MTRRTLVLANLLRRRRRTALTVLGIAIALFLFVTLRSVVSLLNATAELGGESTLIVRNRLGIVFPLPLAYRGRIESIPGVTRVSWANWFGGVYVDERNFFPQFAVDPASYLELRPGIRLDPAERAAWLRDRGGAIVARDLLERFGWRVGQAVTLRGTIFPGEHRFTIRGAFDRAGPGGERVFLFHWEYLRERYRGSSYMNNVGWYIVGIDDPARAPAVARAIDELFENSAAPTRSETEQAFQASFLSMYGDVALYLDLVGGAVVFAILLVAANTMAMSARERFPEVAVMKTLGFTDGHVFRLVLAEAAAIAGLGLAMGLGGALLLYNVQEFDAGGFIPGLRVTGGVAAAAAAIAAVLALVSGVLPAWQSARLRVVEALRHTA